MRKLYDLPSLNSIGTVFNVNFLKVVLVTPLEVLGCGDPVGGPDGDFSGVFDTLFAVFSTLCSFPVLPTVRFYFCMYLKFLLSFHLVCGKKYYFKQTIMCTIFSYCL